MSSFTIYPAIDIRGGKCVRLLQGDYQKETVYGDSPLEMASHFVSEGAEWIHLVDLDGAREGMRVNHEHVLEIASKLPVKVQVGGGIRTEEDIAYYLAHGVERVILGSAAIANPAFVKEMLQTYKERIAIGIDAKDGYVATEGWLHTSTVKATDLGIELANAGARVFIFTDIATDGMLTGPNLQAVADLAKATGQQVIASGGVSSLEDIRNLQTYRNEGIAGAIVGKAIYTKQFTLSEAIEEVTI